MQLRALEASSSSRPPAMRGTRCSPRRHGHGGRPVGIRAKVGLTPTMGGSQAELAQSLNDIGF
eukprot:639225-Pyramimonas_sp.AAC.1